MSDLYDKATVYMESGDLVRAEKFYKKLLRVDPTHPEGNLNYGAILKNRGDLSNALRYFEKAINARPGWSYPYNNAGLVYHNWGKEEIAEKYFRRAIKLQGDYADAHWNLGLSLLKRGFSGFPELLEEGWNEYSWRFRKSGPVKLAVVPNLPLYEGSGRCLIVPEQGFGDYIMFSGCLNSDMKVLDLPRFHDLAVILGVDLATDEDEFDCWLPMGSLAEGGIKKITREFSGGSDIGIVWAGNPEHGNDKFRSRNESEFAWLQSYAMLAEAGKVKSFQFGKTGKIFGAPCTTSWIETFRELAKCKMLITVDTSVAHLAGWMGVPTCCLVPSIDTDFRWGLGRHDTEWYTSMYIARSMDDVKDYVKNFPR